MEFINCENWLVYGGASIENNCIEIRKVVRSGEAAALALGAAYMFNYVSSVIALEDKVSFGEMPMHPTSLN